VAGAAAIGGSGAPTVGPLEVHLDGPGSSSLRWSLANRSDAPVAVRSVAVVLRVVDAGEPLRLFRHGYQSWSTTGAVTFGVDTDPSLVPDSIELTRGVHHADQRATRPGELRSEWVTVLRGGDGDAALVGFEAGTEHDGTLRLRHGADGPELWCEAFLGDAVLAPGEHRLLHGVEIEWGGPDQAPELLAGWAARAGAFGGARVGAPYQVGWCSWYHYFHDITEDALRANLARAAAWPFDVFQLDDGFQSAIGDWLTTNDKFPSELDAIAASIAAAGRTPGLWIAPFIVAPDSRVATEHPDWLARYADGSPLFGMVNPEWGGGLDGLQYALDTTHPAVLTHLEHVARTLVDAGFPYLKLDFTFAPSFDGVWADPSRTPAQRVRAGYEAIRRGAGDDTFILGCGVPLSHVVGLVDGNRIGPDVAPSWAIEAGYDFLPGYTDCQPATLHAFRNTLARAHQHRRLWLNDPDCLMLRQAETRLSPAAARTWAETVAVSGGMALVSDDLALLDDDARRLLDEVVAIGREVDAAARTGAPPRCGDILERPIPGDLSAAGWDLTVDPVTAESSLFRRT